MEEIRESNFRFISTKLKGLTYELNDSYDIKSPIKLIIHTETKVLKGEYNARVTLELTIFDKDYYLNNEAPFYIDIIMEGDFEWDDSINDGILEIMLENNAPAVLLSYIRPYISSLTVGSGYPPLVIPLLNFKKNKAVYINKNKKL